MEYPKRNLQTKTPISTYTSGPREKITKVSMILFILLIVAPLVFALLMTTMATPAVRQYGLLQIIVMGAYNLPAVLISMAFLFVGIFTRMKNERVSNVFYGLSIFASVAGILSNAFWFLSAFSF